MKKAIVGKYYWIQVEANSEIELAKAVKINTNGFVVGFKTKDCNYVNVYAFQEVEPPKEIKKSKNDFPETWKEYLVADNVPLGFDFEDYPNISDTYKARIKLDYLCEFYNQIDKTNSNIYYTIVFNLTDVTLVDSHRKMQLSFKSLEVAELFLGSFRELIIQAKPLISHI